MIRENPSMKIVISSLLVLNPVVIIIFSVASCFRGDLQASQISIDRRHEENLSIWYGPGSIHTVTRAIRDDFLDQVTHKENWPTVYSHTKVFKQFIESLYPEPRPATGRPRYREEELRRLADFANQNGLQCAFEIGALRLSKNNTGVGAGQRYAEQELAVLKRWVDVGGRVDHLTTDHAVMWNLGLILQGDKPMAGLANPDWRMILSEVVKSLVAMKKAFPNAKIGMIESLGYFSIKGHKSKGYRSTDPGSIYPIDLGLFLVEAKSQLLEAGIKLDHFHIDFSYHDCRYDGKAKGVVDYGRIMAAERIIKSADLDVGMIINAFDDYTKTGANMVVEKQKAKNAKSRNRSAIKNTLDYLKGYLNAGGDPDHWIFQRWQPYPFLTGPETVLESDMGLTKKCIDMLSGGE